MTPTVLMLVTSGSTDQPPARGGHPDRGRSGHLEKGVRYPVSSRPCRSCPLEFVDELVDGQLQPLPAHPAGSRPSVYVEAGATHLADLGETPVPFQETNSSVLAALLEQATSVLRF